MRKNTTQNMCSGAIKYIDIFLKLEKVDCRDTVCQHILKTEEKKHTIWKGLSAPPFRR